MKNKIVFKLIAYFTITLLLFSLIIGSVFITLFKKHTIDLHKIDMENRAAAIADTISNFSGGKGGSGMGHGQYGTFFRFLDEIAMTDVWIVDENLSLFTMGRMSHKHYIYKDLPEDAEIVVKEVFQGKTIFSEGFSNLHDSPVLTLGMPIVSRDRIIGALLLHSPVEGMSSAVSQGLRILMTSLASALVLSIVLSILLALAFTKPLNRMKNSAVLLALGDYAAKTGVKQNDEIGELAQAIDTLSEKLDLASQENQKLHKLRNDFVANISHELRTPVTVIRGSLEALNDEVITDRTKVREYHRQILNESICLQRLINDLLDLSRLQNTDFQIEMKELNLCEVINDVVRSTQSLSQSKDIEVIKELDTDVLMYTGDYGRLRQMLLIILDNAIKFSSDNSIVIISLKDNMLSIIDKGKGIPAEDLPYIFDRFYKVKSKENMEGTGLGLAISKQIADRHNIKLSVSSNGSEGTEFRFLFTGILV
ncbi:MAG: cell wall metabolism sensor histidine kinase WalK [Firmicutes bacterium]|nr:cell wall metabolism sensor histidine kinase WalK [Bacillota bacterium]